MRNSIAGILGILLFVAAAFSQETGGSIQILGKAVLHQPSETLALWPNILRNNAGELVLVFTGDKFAVDDPLGRVYAMKSADEGKSWSTPKEILRTPLDTRYPALTQLSSGEYLLSYYPAIDYMNAIIPEGLSEDAKQTWENLKRSTRPSRIEKWNHPSLRCYDSELNPIRVGIQTHSFSHHGPTLLEAGRVILVGQGTIEGGTSAVIIDEATPPSFDDWNTVTTMPAPPLENPAFYRTPSAIQLSNGNLLALFGYEHLTQPGMNFLRRSFSADGGKTWSIPRMTRMWGTEPHAIELGEEKVVAVYAFPAPRYSLRAVLSSDGGRSWDCDQETILSQAPTSDISGGASVLLKDGSVLTVYHQAPDETSGPCIHSVRWTTAN